jgi:hypothetical protein
MHLSPGLLVYRQVVYSVLTYGIHAYSFMLTTTCLSACLSRVLHACLVWWDIARACCPAGALGEGYRVYCCTQGVGHAGCILSHICCTVCVPALCCAVQILESIAIPVNLEDKESLIRAAST